MSSTILAADWQLTKDDYPHFHLGVEQTVLWNSIAFRFGVSGNPFNLEETKVISGGAGLKIFGVFADVAIIGLDGQYPDIELSGGFRD